MKGKIDNRKIVVTNHKDGQPKEVKTCRVNPNVWDAADQLCKEQHNCGVSSIVEQLILSYFGLNTKTPPPEWKKRFPLLFPKSAQT